MIYRRNNEKKLSDGLFYNPTSEYRGTPFWAWNASLDNKELEEQIDIFKEMGFGGFHMHVRQGLEVPYLSEEFMKAVRNCTQKAKREGMLAWLYDEDRWPSGYAGGFVTKHIKYRQKYLLMTKKVRESAADKEEALATGSPFLLGVFDVEINSDGEMTAYRKISPDDSGENKWYFYVCIKPGGEAEYNDQCYADTLCKEAVDYFIDLTYEAYKENVGDEFGKTIPAIFSDEPNVMNPVLLENGFTDHEGRLCWTMDFDDTYRKTYGEDILEVLPELAFAMPEGEGYAVRYQYYKHVTDRFAESYMDNVGKWCGRNHVMFTGHLMGEDTLFHASGWMGDSMRMYKEMQLPGIDMLYDNRAYVTAKQCQSVVHQYGREGMLSELYGVTGWDFDFRGHKLQGDWQTCLGVTVRVPHLAWQTMRGEGKRDYPASIFYQSPWYKEYRRIEDYFARINTVMTRGKACVKTAVLHPIESYWLLRGSNAETLEERSEMDRHFAELAEWLLFGCVDFDYMAESLLEDLCGEGNCPLKVGEMQYDTIIAEDCKTLRPHTIKVLRTFAEKGGRIIFMGTAPSFSLGRPSGEAVELTSAGEYIPHSKAALYKALKNSRDVRLRKTDGSMTDHLIYQLRQDGEDRWLFVANAGKPELSHIPEKQEICITVNGICRPLVYNALTGEIEKIAYRNTGEGNTEIYACMYSHDSLLLRLAAPEKAEENESVQSTAGRLRKDRFEEEYDRGVLIDSQVQYEMEEPNVLPLDMARYSVDGGPLKEAEEILRIDEKVRKQLHLRSRRYKVIQPWVIADEPENHRLKLEFSVESKIDYEVPMLAVENLHKAEIVWNGAVVESREDGWYVDKYLSAVKLPRLKKGTNHLVITMPFGLRTDLENCYLLGDFGVYAAGRKIWIGEKAKKLQYGDVTNQGLAFYGGNIRYISELNLEAEADVELELSYYRGALIKVLVDEREEGCIMFAPYRLKIKRLAAGRHNITFVLYGNRYNTFSALHTLTADKKGVRIGPDFWRSGDFQWAYEYQTRPLGILKTPVCRINLL